MLKFDITDEVITLIIGIGIGIVLFFITLAIISLRYKKELSTYGPQTDNPISDEELTELIKEKLIAFKNNEDEQVSDINFTIKLVQQLVESIARRYYPNSKYPMYELTIDELIQLNYHVTKRVENILGYKMLGFSILAKVKRMRISDILKNLEESKLKKQREAEKTGVFHAIKKATNKVNPLRMLKEAGIETAIKFVCKNLIKIAAEESQNTYSKQLFSTPQVNLELLTDEYEEVTE